MLKLTQKLTTQHFIFSQIIILIVGLIFAGWLYNILYIQHQPQDQNSFQTGPVTTQPKTLRIDLNEPEDDMLTYSSQILISGKTKPLTEILISSDFTDAVIESKADGSFSHVFDLEEGVNRITAAVFDEVGEVRMVEKQVYYSKEKI
jgi:hypothetical protein